ncbi:hypothetical protein N7517_010848 [Penicillium concentricum]|uniref:Uncharacterized protein n=1 Tax=Penicillium concentricum TaxID=293559 RepID=A0A9W9RCA6_9EURO|nr:uncharacterized protein N7517_010848 [Penicillium concentricum]KAJ5356239.1 hypothetical protein N7517_010848 [Penicillium concentricum]
MAQAPNLIYNPTFFTAEWRVNGLWNRLLHQAAENALGMNGNWQISPEAMPNFGDTNDYKADLLVSRISPLNWNPNLYNIGTPFIHFEGKGAAGQSWTQIRYQIEVWCSRNAEFAPGKPCWAIGAKGSAVKMWLYSTSIDWENQNNNTINSRMIPIYLNAQGQIVLDLVTGQGATRVYYNPLIAADGGNPIQCNGNIGVGGDIWEILRLMFTHPTGDGAGIINPIHGFVP